MTNLSAQIEKETGAKMVITIREHGLPSIEEFSDGVSMGEGVYSHEGVAKALLQSLDYSAIRTPILPRNAFFYSEGPMIRFCFMEIPAHKRTVSYHKAVLKGVPFPRLVFGFKMMLQQEKLQIADVMVAALDSESIMNEDSKVYFYPYTNVERDFTVCWGGQQLPTLNRISQLTTFPEMFFNSPNSDCYYNSANLSKKTYRELVESLKGKKFPDEYLKSTGYTLQEWINKLSTSM